MLSELRAVIFDWAGTVVDFGCMAPVDAFVGVFAGEGVRVSPAEARLPMGLGKHAHIDALLDLPGVAARWRAAKGAAPTAADADRLFDALEHALAEAIVRHGDLMPGLRHLCRELQRAGVKVGTTTGYSRAAMEPLIAHAAAQGFAPSVIVCAGETPRGRPHGDQMEEALRRLGLDPATEGARCVKIDDTGTGLQEGLAAGAWAIGIGVSGNAGGMTRAAWEALDHDGQQAVRRAAQAALEDAGAHFVCDSVADSLPLIEEIARRVVHRERP
jgi:phosphonoacetaldehyde hydrolase